MVIVISDSCGSEGSESWARLCEQWDFNRHTPFHEIADGGMQLFFAHPGVKLSTAIDLYPGIDLHSDGSYVLMPPSVVNGNPCKLVFGAPTNQLMHLPDGFLEEIRFLTGDSARNRSHEGSDDDDSPAIITLSNVSSEAVQFLWPNRLAIGKVTLLEGDPGIGKSWITQSISASVSTGSGLPGWANEQAPGDVLLMNAEDGLADKLRTTSAGSRPRWNMRSSKANFVGRGNPR